MGFEVIERRPGGTLTIGVSIASVCALNGSDIARVGLGRDILGKLGWKGGARIGVAQNGRELRLRRDPAGFTLIQGGRSIAAYLNLTALASPKPMPRKAVKHRIKNGALYITLPDWAVKAT